MVKLYLLSFHQWQQSAPRTWYGTQALAWHRPGQIYCLDGADSLRRITHECMHELHGDNSIHHPWWHFCILSAHPSRRWRHFSPAARAMAQRLLVTPARIG